MLTIKPKQLQILLIDFFEKLLTGCKNKYSYNPYVKQYVFFGIICSTLSHSDWHTLHDQYVSSFASEFEDDNTKLNNNGHFYTLPLNDLHIQIRRYKFIGLAVPGIATFER